MTVRILMSGAPRSLSSATPFRVSCLPSCSSCCLPVAPFSDWFPASGAHLRLLDQLPGCEKMIDYFWHLILPVISLELGAFATATFLTQNSFLDEIRKQYVLTARVKGLRSRKVLYGHVFRNAMLVIVSDSPAPSSALFSRRFLIETIFSLDGLGLLSSSRSQPRLPGRVREPLYLFAGRAFRGLISDLTYTRRSADRLRDARGVTWTRASPPKIQKSPP